MVETRSGAATAGSGTPGSPGGKSLKETNKGEAGPGSPRSPRNNGRAQEKAHQKPKTEEAKEKGSAQEKAHQKHKTEEAKEKGSAKEAGEKEQTSPKKRGPSSPRSPKAKRQAKPSGDTLKTIESGKVYFFYRPKVNTEAVTSADQIQHFHMLMEPSGSSSPCRMLQISKKHLPSASKHERLFGFVEAVGDKAELLEGLGAETYETKTRGKQHLGVSRACGEAAYSLVDKNSGTHFAYRLEVPDDPGEAQKMCGIEKEASCILSIKNPDRPSNVNIGLKNKADYPEDLRKEFEDYSFIAVKTPKLLDYPRAEILLVGAAEDIEENLGEAGKKIEERAEQEEPKAESEVKEAANIKGQNLDVEPAITGKAE